MSDPLYLIAQVADRAVAVETASVLSVVDIDAVTPVPGVAPAVAGLAALRSRVVTVIDTRVALGLPSLGGWPARAIITRVDGHDYAMLVDVLEDIAAHPARPLPAGAHGAGWDRAARGLIERDGAPVLVVALDALVPGSAGDAA